MDRQDLRLAADPGVPRVAGSQLVPVLAAWRQSRRSQIDSGFDGQPLCRQDIFALGIWY